MSIVFRPDARVELADLVVSIAAADPAAASRFEAEVHRTIALLEANPRMGARVGRPGRNVPGLRFANVRRYRQFIILYLPLPAGVEILHIIRGRRSIRRVVAND